MAPIPGTANADRLILFPLCGEPFSRKRGCCPERLPLVYVPSSRLPASWPEMVRASSVGVPEANQVIPEIVQLSSGEDVRFISCYDINMTSDLSPAEYRALAEFRYQIRR